MKKIFAILLCLLLVASFAVTAFAADAVEMTLAADKLTVMRGDTVEFTITMPEVTGCKSGGFSLDGKYDDSVFEFVDGECPLDGTMLEKVGYTGGKLSGSFMYSAGTTVSGKVFVIRMKVKDTAAFAKTTFAPTVSARNGAGAMTATCNTLELTVVDHSWGDWTKVDDTNHKRVCGAECPCADGPVEQTAAHTWDAGKVTKEPTCKETGVKTYTCTDCKATKTEDIAKTEDHKFGAWTEVDGTNHKHTCSVCSKEETAAHAWDAGKVTKEPTCKETGVKTYTCTDCKATKTEDIAKTEDHKFGAWTEVDGKDHKRTCSVCSKEETAAHVWDAGKVTTEPTCKEKGVKTFTCTVCNATKTEDVDKTEDHKFGAWTEVDGKDHKRTCSVCSKEETATHVWDNGKVTKEPTCKEEGVKTFTCTVCNATKTEDIAKTEDHTWGAWESVDATSHKRVCSVCEKTETAAHAHGDELTGDTTSHWFACVCGAKKDEAQHTYDATKWESDAEKHWHECACGEKSAVADHNWDEGKETVAPTNKTEGVKTHTCKDCAAVKTVAIPKIENSDTSDATMIVPFVLLMVLSAAGVAVTVIGKKRIAR